MGRNENDGKRAVSRFMIITSNSFKDADSHIESLGYKTEQEKLAYVRNLFHVNEDASLKEINDYKHLLITIMKSKRSQRREQL